MEAIQSGGLEMLENKIVGHIALLIALGCLVSQTWAKPIRGSKTEASPIGERAKKTSPTPIPASPQKASPRQERQPHPKKQTASIDIDSLALYSGKSLLFRGKNVVDAPIAAAGYLSMGNGSKARSLYSGGKVYLGIDSKVRGDIWANGNVNIRDNSYVDGNVISRGNYWKHKTATVTGNVQRGKNAELLVLPSMETAPSGERLGETIWGGRGTATNLASGSYDTAGFDRNATLNLSAGTYTMKSFWMDKEGSVNVDTSLGDVILNVHSGFSVGRDVTFNTLGDGDLFVNVFDKDVWLDNNAKMDATVRVFKGKFGAGKDVVLTGTFHASDNISLGQGSQVTYASSGSTVPEPTTIALLACGGMMCILRKYRRT